MQRDFPMVGCLTRPMRVHTAAEMALCQSKVDAALLSLRTTDLSQETIAERMPMDAGHLSRLVNGRRPWNERWQARFERLTGSFALTQWDCKARGGEFYADPRAVERAQLHARLAELNQEAA
jgi:hypothetical protein